VISAIKKSRKNADKLKKDYTPTHLQLGELEIFLARHFGFCYGVENAIEISFRAVAENPGKRIFLLSEMIHNPQVNADLLDAGVTFIMDTHGQMLMDWNELKPEDVVIIPAFGTTIEIEEKLKSLGIEPQRYNTTCPFVERVWNKAEQIGEKGYTVVVHGKPKHEETKATFSHSRSNTHTVIVKDMDEAILLAKYMTGEKPAENFFTDFKDQHSEGFDPLVHLDKIGVVNQTTMLATETQGIADFLKNVIIKKFNLNKENLQDHFADTRDTLCYATNDNQTAVKGLLETQADLAIVVGGYNSSNTSHLVELCEEQLPTYYINAPDKLVSATTISHWDFHHKNELVTENYLPANRPVKVLITSGASCPDALVEEVIGRLAGFFPGADTLLEKATEDLLAH
jgi:4-hydroxy-3-methylbut-2-enyl diphosphate reductase